MLKSDSEDLISGRPILQAEGQFVACHFSPSEYVPFRKIGSRQLKEILRKAADKQDNYEVGQFCIALLWINMSKLTFNSPAGFCSILRLLRERALLRFEMIVSFCVKLLSLERKEDPTAGKGFIEEHYWGLHVRFH